MIFWHAPFIADVNVENYDVTLKLKVEHTVRVNLYTAMITILDNKVCIADYSV